MSRITLVSINALTLAACAKPIKLALTAPAAPSASVIARLTKGEKGPTPDRCDLPCGVDIAPGSTCEITVTAPGFYPAVMSVTYDQMAPVNSGDAVSLSVPLVRRPPPPQPSETDTPSEHVPHPAGHH